MWEFCALMENKLEAMRGYQVALKGCVYKTEWTIILRISGGYL